MACVSPVIDGLPVDPTLFLKIRKLEIQPCVKVMNSTRWSFDGKVDSHLTCNLFWVCEPFWSVLVNPLFRKTRRVRTNQV